MAFDSRKKGQLHGRSADKPLPLILRLMRFLFRHFGGIMPGIMGRWAYALWFRTHRFPEAAAGKRAVESAQRETLQVEKIPVVVYSWGEGPVVLFVHGWSGRGSQVAAFIKPLNRAGFRVVAIDAPGHGNTPGNKTNILECASVLLAVAQSVGPVFAVITHSFGGMVLTYALNNGLKIERAACISAPADVNFLLERFARTLNMHPSVRQVLNNLLENRFRKNFNEEVSTVSNARRLAVPALIVHDADDEGVPWQQGQQIADAWPGARFLKTHGLGHGRILRDSATVESIVDFISGSQ